MFCLWPAQPHQKIDATSRPIFGGVRPSASARFHIQLQTIEKLSSLSWKASGILIFQFVIRDMFETIICFIGFTIMSLYSRLARSLSSGSVVANARHPHPVLS